MIADCTGIQRETILSLGINDADSVLDVGCGSGAKTFYISEHAKQVVGIDPDKNMIEAAKNNFVSKNLDFQVGRAESMNFPSSEFTSVLFNESFHHIPVEKQTEALNGSCRVLAPKGKLLIIEPVNDRGSFEEILTFYNDEREQRLCAQTVIEASADNGFEIALKKTIHIEYSCKGFDDLYQNDIKTKPYVYWNESNKQDIIHILERCENTPEGDYMMDYFASVWLLIKR
jgi:ubiquinone/menaquinone biosynthesis C-methylase UbiE